LIQTKIIDIVNAPTQSDEVLYASYIEGRDREVLGSLFKKYMSLVFGVGMKYLSDKAAAQDATMEVFEKLIEYIPNSEIKNFKGYLYVMTRNHCLMKQRGEKVYTVEISDRDVEMTSEVHPIDEVEEKYALLDKCMKLLKEQQMQCVESFYLKKKSYAEISSELSLAITAVKSHIQNGKRNQKICMEGNK
jgi:RNA polymerase sigma factor (sigma-70 family)